jgi:multiple sugar transport system substrate-binding protein
VEGVSAKSKHQEQAWKFVKFLTSKESAVRLYAEASKLRLFGEPYARKDLATTIESDPYVGAFAKQAPDARSFPLASRTFDNGINDTIIKYLEDAINNASKGSAPGSVLNTYSQGVRQVLGSYGLVSVSK